MMMLSIPERKTIPKLHNLWMPHNWMKKMHWRRKINNDNINVDNIHKEVHRDIHFPHESWANMTDIKNGQNDKLGNPFKR